MSESFKEIETLDGEDTDILNRKGWHLVTHYRARKDSDGSSAYNNAVERCNAHNRQTGIRTIIKNDHTYYEVWDFWK